MVPEQVYRRWEVKQDEARRRRLESEERRITQKRKELDVHERRVKAERKELNDQLRSVREALSVT